MGAIFGKRPNSAKAKQPPSKVTENDRVVLKLKQQRDKIKQYQKRINLQLERERDVVRKLVQENKKDRALLLLKKKRYMESLLDKSDGQLANIEQMVQTIEFQEMQIDIVERLKDGNEALRKLNEALDIDQIEDILQETKEGAEKQKEISRLFAGQAEADEQDEDELLRELKELTGEDAAGEQVAGEAGDEREPQLPEVSKEPIEVSKVQIEDGEESDVERTERVKANKKVLLEAS